VLYAGRFETPEDDDRYNSPYSVEMINRREVAWLRKGGEPIAWAGDSIEQFESAVYNAGGTTRVLEGLYDET
jgi:hypothetical protein